MQEIYFAGGCFWGTEHFFKQIQGVLHTQTGFANGNETLPNPTYDQVYTDLTGYAETVKVQFDETQISLALLANMFFVAIDPFSHNQQGNDIGTRYRTGIYYVNEAQLPTLRKVFNEQQAQFDKTIAVELLPLRNFFPADEYHQNYLDKHPDGYCHLPKKIFDLARQIISERQARVLQYLTAHDIPFSFYNHPPVKTIEESRQYWRNDGSIHCKNLFLRNHKGTQHYLISFPSDEQLPIRDLEQSLKATLLEQGQNAPGKLSFASPERMMCYLGLEPGSVSPFGLINDTEHHVILFLDSRLQNAQTLSFHPNDCRSTVVITQDAFRQYLKTIKNKVEYLFLNEKN